jgi:prephenate dehydrogenase
MQIKKVAIIGVGLMGGSLALALRKSFPDFDVWGYARSEESFKRVNQYLPGKVERDLEKLLKDADLVFFALPVGTIIEYFQKTAGFLKPGAIVCDLASTKADIEKAAKKFLKGVKFVGCHPLCGAEKSGIENSDPDLYKDAVCVITAPETKRGVSDVIAIWQALGMRVKFLLAVGHDELFSAVSHLPHVIAFSLINSVDLPNEQTGLLPPSFKDLTRISGSPADVWADIFFSNKKNLSKDIKKMQLVLKEFSGILKSGSKDKMKEFIIKANKRFFSYIPKES